jgi:transposase
MFLKRIKRRKKGGQHVYWALMESYRTARGPRNRVVAYLGELKPSEQSGWAQLARQLDGRDRPQPSLFDPPRYDEPEQDEPVLVDLKGVRLERVRDFGDVWLGLGLWRLVGLDKLLGQVMDRGREQVPWPVMAAILTIARLCEPTSELHIEDTWYDRTALDDLLDVRSEKVHTDRLYAALDQLLPHKDVIERHLKTQLGDLFDLKFDMFLYDVTSTYFEGECASNPMARRGYSRDHRPDCPQVCIGLVVTPDGIPLGHEVFDGNTNDSTTVETVVRTMEAKYGRADRVWVLDRGMVSEDNLRFIRERGGSYIVGTPKAMLRQFESHLMDKDWREVHEGVEVKLAPAPDGDEIFILARSADRREKEKAIHQRFIDRMEAGLQQMQRSAQTGRLKDLATANRRLGRLSQRCWRAAGGFDVTIKEISNPAGKARVSITWNRNDRWSQWTTLSEGCYLLRTNLIETDPATLWKQYIQLTEAEWAFRITKDELNVRPIWHQRADRVKGHILVCFLAYVLWKTLAHWMQRASLGDAPRTVLEEFARIKSGDVVLPTRTSSGRPGKAVHLRCVTQSDKHQTVLLNRLGLALPQRLRRSDIAPNVVAALASNQPSQPIKADSVR